MKPIDLSGQRFGKLIARYRGPGPLRNGISWLCDCDCGRQRIIPGWNLRRGITRSCGCLMDDYIRAKVIDLTGFRYGRLTVVARSPELYKSGGSKRILWICRCDCGDQLSVMGQALRSGNTKSCGCLNEDRIGTSPQKRPRARRRRRTVKRQTPAWANRREMEEIYANRPPGYHVDHVIPLNGEFVSGLHVPSNLQYLPSRDNLSKANQFGDPIRHLFEEL